MFVVKLSVRFTLTFILAGQFVLTRQDISSCVHGDKTLFFWTDIGSSLGQFVTIKSDFFDKSLGHFQSCFCLYQHISRHICGNKKEIFWQVSRHFQLCSWRKITDIYNKMSTHFQTCLSAIKQAFFSQTLEHFHRCLWQHNQRFLTRCQDISSLNHMFLTAHRDISSHVCGDRTR